MVPFGRRGLPGASVVVVGAVPWLLLFLRVQSRTACFIALGAVACSLLICLRRSGARRVIPAVAGWFGP